MIANKTKKSPKYGEANPPAPSSIKERFSSEKGIALLMVLWALTILMVIVLSFSLMARTETHATLSFKEGMEKKFLAEAAVERGIMEIFYRKQNLAVEGRDIWKADGTSYTGHLGGGDYTVRIMEESGKIDINTLNDSSAIILKTLLINSGVQEEDADTIVDSILDWKDADDLHRLHGAESDYYMSLPNPYKAKDANFDTLEELLLVKGITPEILYGTDDKKGIINFITVNSHMNTINVNTASKEVLMAIPGITPETADGIISYRENKRITNVQEVGIPSQGPQYIAPFESNTFTIEAVGYKGSEKPGYTIKATVSIDADNKYRFIYYKSPMAINQ